MAKSIDHKVVLTLPDLGLDSKQVNVLKRKFKNEITTSMGGAEALARRRIVIVIVIIVIRNPR